MTSEGPTQLSALDYSKNVRGEFYNMKDPQKLSLETRMLSKRSVSTTEKFLFSWPGSRPRKKQQKKKLTISVPEENNNPSTIEHHAFSWPKRMYKKKNRVKNPTTTSGDVQSTSYPDKKTTTAEEFPGISWKKFNLNSEHTKKHSAQHGTNQKSSDYELTQSGVDQSEEIASGYPNKKTTPGKTISTTIAEEYPGISWKKFNLNSEHTSIHVQTEKHTTQLGTGKTSSIRYPETEIDQESLDYELTQSGLDYQSGEISSNEYPDYYSSETDAGNIEHNDVNENPTSSEPSELYYSSQADVMNEEAESENPYSISEAILTLGNNEETTQEISGVEINQDIVTSSDENLENPVEQKPTNELSGLDSQQKKKLFELADELLKDSTEEKSTGKFDHETPEISEETIAEYENASPPSAENDYGKSQNLDEGSSMQPEETKEISSEGTRKSSEESEVTEIETSEIMKKVTSQYMTQIKPETTSEELQYVGESFNETEASSSPSELTIVTSMETPESPLKSPDEEEQEYPLVSEENGEIEFGNSTVIYNETEEELSSPRVGEEFDLSGELETELPESEWTVKNTEKTASTNPSSPQESMAEGQNNTSAMNAETTSKEFSSSKPLLTTKTSSAKYMRTSQAEELESNKKIKPKTEKMKDHTRKPIVSTTSELGSTETPRENEEESVTTGKTTNTIGMTEELASRSTVTKYMKVTDYDENDEFARISALPEYQEYESEMGTSEGISNSPSTVKHVKSTTIGEEISEETEISVEISTSIKEVEEGVDEEPTKEFSSDTHRKLSSTELTTLFSKSSTFSETEKTTSEPSQQPSPRTTEYQKFTKETNGESLFTEFEHQKTKAMTSEKTTEFPEFLTHSEIRSEITAPAEPSTHEISEPTKEEKNSAEVEIFSVPQESEEGEIDYELSTISLSSPETTEKATHRKEMQSSITIFEVKDSEANKEFSKSSTSSTKTTATSTHVPSDERRSSQVTSEGTEFSSIAESKEPVKVTESGTTVHEIGIKTKESTSEIVSQVDTGLQATIELTEMQQKGLSYFSEATETILNETTVSQEIVATSTEASEETSSNIHSPMSTETESISTTEEETNTEGEEMQNSSIKETVSWIPSSISPEEILGTSGETSSNKQVVRVSTVTLEEVELTEPSINITESGIPTTETSTLMSTESGLISTTEKSVLQETSSLIPFTVTVEPPEEFELSTPIIVQMTTVVVVNASASEVPSSFMSAKIESISSTEATEELIKVTKTEPTENTIIHETSSWLPSTISTEHFEEGSSNTPIIVQMLTVVEATASAKYISPHETSPFITLEEKKLPEESVKESKPPSPDTSTHETEPMTFTSKVSSTLALEGLETTVMGSQVLPPEISSNVSSTETELVPSTKAEAETSTLTTKEFETTVEEGKLEETVSPAHLSSENGYQKPTGVEIISKITFEPYGMSSIVPLPSEEAEATPLFQFSMYNRTNLLSTVESSTTPFVPIESFSITEISSVATIEITSQEEYKKTEVTPGPEEESLTISSTLPEVSTEMGTHLPGEVETTSMVNEAWTLSESLLASTTESQVLEEVKTSTNVPTSGTSTISINSEIETTLLFEPNKYEETEVSRTENQLTEVEAISVMSHVSSLETSSLFSSTITLETTESSSPFQPKEETETAITSPHEALLLTSGLTQVSVDNGSQLASTNEMGNQVSEETSVTTETKNVISNESLASTPASEEATSATFSVSTEVTQVIGKQMPKEYKETPRNPYIPFYERPSSVTAAVTGDTSWSPITESVIAESEISTQQLSTAMLEGIGTRMISTTESNLQILTETSKLEQVQNVSLGTETPLLVVSEKESLFGNVSTESSWRSVTETGAKAKEITPEVTPSSASESFSSSTQTEPSASSQRTEELLKPLGELFTSEKIHETTLEVVNPSVLTTETVLSKIDRTSEITTTSAIPREKPSSFETTAFQEKEEPSKEQLEEFVFTRVLDKEETTTERLKSKYTSPGTTELEEAAETIYLDENLEEKIMRYTTVNPKKTTKSKSKPTKASQIPTAEERIESGSKIKEATDVSEFLEYTEVAGSSGSATTAEITEKSDLLEQETESLVETSAEQITASEIPEETTELFSSGSIEILGSRVTSEEDTGRTEMEVESTVESEAKINGTYVPPTEETGQTQLISYSERLEETTEFGSSEKIAEEVTSASESTTGEGGATEASSHSGEESELGYSEEIAKTSKTESESTSNEKVATGTPEATIETISEIETLPHSKYTPGLSHPSKEIAEFPELKVTTSVEQAEYITEESKSTAEEGIRTENSSEEISGFSYPLEEGAETPEINSESILQHKAEASEATVEEIEGTNVSSYSEETAKLGHSPESAATLEIEIDSTVKHEEVTEASESKIGKTAETEAASHLEKSEVEPTVEHEEGYTEVSESIIGESAETETPLNSEETTKLGHSSEGSAETSELGMESTRGHEGEVTEASELTIEENTETSETEIEQRGKITEASASENPQEISDQNFSVEEGTRASIQEEETTSKHEKNVTEVSKTVIEKSTEIESSTSSEESEETFVEGGESTLKHEKKLKTSESVIGISIGIETTSHFEETSELGHYFEGSTETSEIEMESTNGHEGVVSETSELRIKESTETSEIEVEHEGKLTEASPLGKPQKISELRPSIESGTRASDLEEATTMKHKMVVTEVSQYVIKESTENESSSSSEESKETSVEVGAETELEIQTTIKHEGTISEASELPIAESTETSETETTFDENAGNEAPLPSEEILGMVHFTEENTETSQIEVEMTIEHEGEFSKATELSIEESSETSGIEVEYTFKHEENVTETSSSEMIQEISKPSSSIEEGTKVSDLENAGNEAPLPSEEILGMVHFTEENTETSQIEVEMTIEHEGEFSKATELSIEESSETSEIEVESSFKHKENVTEISSSEMIQEIWKPNSSTEEGTKASDLEATTIKHKNVVTEVSQYVFEESTENETSSASEESEETSDEGGAETEIDILTTIKHEGEISEASELPIAESTETSETETIFGEIAGNEGPSPSEEILGMVHFTEENTETSQIEVESSIEHEGEVSKATELSIEESSETSEIEVESSFKHKENVTETSSSDMIQEISKPSSSIEEGTEASDLEATTIKHKKVVTEVSQYVFEESTENETSSASEESEETSDEGGAETELEILTTVEHEGEISEASELPIAESTETSETETIFGENGGNEAPLSSEEILGMVHFTEENTETSQIEVESSIEHEGEVSKATELSIEESSETSEIEVEKYKENVTETSSSEMIQEISKPSSSIEEGTEASDLEATTIKHKKVVTEVSQYVFEESTENETSSASEESEETSDEGGAVTELEKLTTVKHKEEISEASELPIAESTETSETETIFGENGGNEAPLSSEEILGMVHFTEENTETSQIEVESSIEHEGEVSKATELSIEESSETSEIEVESTLKHKENVTETSSAEMIQKISKPSSSIEEGTKVSDLEEATTIKHKKVVTEVSQYVIEESTENESSSSSEESEETSVEGGAETELKIRTTVKHEEEISVTSELPIAESTETSETETTFGENAGTEAPLPSEEILGMVHFTEENTETSQIEVESTIEHEEEVSKATELSIEESSESSGIEVEYTFKHEENVTETSSSEMIQEISKPSSSIEEGAKVSDLEEATTIKHKKVVTEVSQYVIEESTENESSSSSEESEETSVEGGAEIELKIRTTVKHEEEISVTSELPIAESTETSETETTFGENAGNESPLPSEEILGMVHFTEENTETSQIEVESTIEHEEEVSKATELSIEESSETSGIEVEYTFKHEENVTETSSSEMIQEISKPSSSIEEGTKVSDLEEATTIKHKKVVTEVSQYVIEESTENESSSSSEESEETSVEGGAETELEIQTTVKHEGEISEASELTIPENTETSETETTFGENAGTEAPLPSEEILGMVHFTEENTETSQIEVESIIEHEGEVSKAMELSIEESSETSEIEVESTSKHKENVTETSSSEIIQEISKPSSFIEEGTKAFDLEVKTTGKHEKEVTEASESLIEEKTAIESTPYSGKSEEISAEGGAETPTLDKGSTVEYEEDISEVSKLHSEKSRTLCEECSGAEMTIKEEVETSELAVESTVRHKGKVTKEPEFSVNSETVSESLIKSTSTSEMTFSGQAITETMFFSRTTIESPTTGKTIESVEEEDKDQLPHFSRTEKSRTLCEECSGAEVSIASASTIKEGVETSELAVESTVRHKGKVTKVPESSVNNSETVSESLIKSTSTSEMTFSGQAITETMFFSRTTIESPTTGKTIESVEEGEKEQLFHFSRTEKSRTLCEECSGAEMSIASASTIKEVEEPSEFAAGSTFRHEGEVTNVPEFSFKESAGFEITSYSQNSEKTSESRHAVEGTKTSDSKVDNIVEQGVTEISERTINKGPETEETPQSDTSEETSVSGHSVKEGAETSELEEESTIGHRELIEGSSETEKTEEAPGSSTEEGAESAKIEEEFTTAQNEVTTESESLFNEGTEFEATTRSEKSKETSESGNSVEEEYETPEIEIESTVESEKVTKASSVLPTEKVAEISQLEKESTTGHKEVIEKGAKTEKTEEASGSSIEEGVSGHSVEEGTETSEEGVETIIGSTSEESKTHPENSEEVDEAQLFHFSVTHETSTVCKECSEEITIQQVNHTSSTGYEKKASSTEKNHSVSIGEESITSTISTEESVRLEYKNGTEISTEEISEETVSDLEEIVEGRLSSHTILRTSKTTEQEAETSILATSSVKNVTNETPQDENTILSRTYVEEETTLKNITLSSNATLSMTPEEEREKTKQSGITSPLTVKFDIKNVSHPSTYMSSNIPESTEEVAEGQLFHFSKTSEGSTLCQECSNVSEKSIVSHEGGKTHIESSTITTGERAHSTEVHGEGSHSTKPILEHAAKPSTHTSEKTQHSTKAHHHKTGITATTKPEDFLQTLTELSGTHVTSTTEEFSRDELPKDAKLLAELGVQDEKFVLKTAIENITEGSHHTSSSKTVIHGAPTHKPHPGSSSTKAVVVIVNNSGKKIEKINETALQKLLNRSISEVNLEYIDLYNISKEPEGRTNKSEIPEVAESLILKGDGKVCQRSEFESNHACVCDVDSYLKSIEPKLGDNLKVDIRHYNCSHLVSFHDGLIISNRTKPVERRKRSLTYLSNKDRSSNVIENNVIEDVFSADYELKTSDSNKLALPGTRALLYCHNKADALLGNEGVSYSWKFNGDASKNGEILPTNENPLIIHNVEIKNEGNYTCTKTEGGKKKTYDHEVEVVTLPIYKIQTTIFYSVNDTCSLSDGDLLFSYLPKIMGPILCGESGKLCTVDVARPRCFTKNDDNFFNVTVTATMNDVGSIFHGLAESKCSNTNCKLKAYANMVGLVNKNAEIVKKLPVFSKINPHLEFLTNVSFSGSKVEISKPPKIITTCAGGYGIEKFKQRICVVCPKNTFSGDDEAFCKICPAGQYQPQAGSKACLPCSSPVDDSMCLRMLYTDTKLFKIYVGVAFGMVLLMIFIIIFWNNSTKRYPKTQFEGSLKHHRAMRRRNITDIEKQDLEPLLKKDKENRRNSPPKVPPPDF